MPKPLSETDKIADLIAAQREHVKAQLLEHLFQLPPYEFEHLVSHLLAAMSFTDCEVTQQYKDGGIDLKANFSIGISEIRTIGQVKRMKATVGTQALQQFYGVLTAEGHRSGVHLGLYVTTSAFASTAVNWVEASNLPIVLIDGAKLVELMVRHGLLVREMPMPGALVLDLPEGTPSVDTVAESVADAETEPSGSGQATGKITFRWSLDVGEQGQYTLRATYLPDPSMTLEVSGVRVPPSGDFRPDRSRLHAKIAEWIEPLFPGLSRNLVRAKAWSGTHRVYPASEYGK
jgi:hypothetical protein